MEPVIVFMMLCATIYGIVYLQTNTRHRERMEMLDKGIDPTAIFGNTTNTKSTKNRLSFYLLFFLKIGMILIGVGVGILLASYLHYVIGIRQQIAMGASVTLSIGISLVIFYLFGRRVERNIKE